MSKCIGPVLSAEQWAWGGGGGGGGGGTKLLPQGICLPNAVKTTLVL